MHKPFIRDIHPFDFNELLKRDDSPDVIIHSNDLIMLPYKTGDEWFNVTVNTPILNIKYLLKD